MSDETVNTNPTPISIADLGDVRVEVPDIRFGSPPPPPVKK